MNIELKNNELTLADTVRKLEELALDSLGEKPGLNTSYESSTPFLSYLRMMGLSAELFLNFLEKATKGQENPPVIIADIGGDAGTAANDLNQMLSENNEKVFEAFQIDEMPSISTKGQGLPLNRNIKANANHMPEIPDNTFHMLVSFNALSYTDLSLSLPEIKRILRPGGVALVDIEFWYKEKDFKGILASGLADEIKILTKGVEPFYFSELKDKLNTFDKTQMRNVLIGASCFVIEK